ncbi:MAG: choline-sulfatase, partial [Paracoccaceae bacterium]
DQLHGFEERLTTDIYPADFGWTPDYRKPGERIDWWYHNMGSVTGAGVAEITNQLEYDDEVAHHAARKLYDLARGADARPWCLTVSFTHPHDPYVARQKYWDLYADCAHLQPRVAAMPYSDQDAHSQRIFDANDWRSYEITATMIERSRRAYFANISYLDEKIGDILEVLDATGQSANILFVSDHGDMLGERGLWFKMSFFEGSSRVPLMISSSDMTPGLVDVPVSTIDVCPTLCELAGVDMDEVAPWTAGESLVALGQGAERHTPVMMEYAAEASYAPMVSLRSGRWKFNRCAIDPDQLFDLEADPNELNNLAAMPEHQAVVAQLSAEVDARWDLAAFDAAVRQSQACRWVVYDALRQGGYYPWDYQPLQQASERFMRNHMDLNQLETAQRYPRGD